MHKQLLVLLIALHWAALTWSSDTPNLSAQIDALFSDYDSADVPGCAIGVIQDGAYSTRERLRVGKLRTWHSH